MKTASFARLLSGCAIAAMIVALAGCYTLLKHPRFETEDSHGEAASATRITYADDCASCHESNAYVAAHGYEASPTHAYDRWYHYYEYPWWISYYGADRGRGNDGDRESSQRPFGRRHRGENENDQPSQTAVTGSGTGAVANPSIISTTGAEPKKEEPKPAEKDDRSGDRRGGNDDKDNRRERKP
jgi:hypothetical protein